MLGSSISGFEALMLQNVSSLPDIKVKDNSSLRHLVNILFEKICLKLDSNASQEEVISETIAQIDAIFNDPEYVEITNTFTRAANQISIEVSKGFNLLRGDIKNNVTSLYEEITDKVQHYLRTQGAEILIGDNTPPSTEFSFLEWNDLRNLAYAQNVIETVCDLASIKQKVANRSTVQYAKAKAMRSGFTKINLNKEIVNKLIDNLVSAIKERGRDEIADAINIFLAPHRYNGYVNNLTSRMSVTDKYAESCTWISDRIDLVRTIARTINQIILPLSDETKSTLFDNMKLVEETTRFGEFYLLFCRNEIFKGQLIVADNLINKDEYQKFVNDGGKPEDIAYYLRAYHKDLPIPTKGISTQRVDSVKDSVHELIKSEDQQVRARRSAIMSQTTARAYHDVLNQFLLNLDESVLPEGMTAKAFHAANYHRIKYTSNTIQGKDANIEDALYTFVIDTFYGDSLVKTLFTTLGREYAAMLARYDNLEQDEMVKLTDNFVVTSIVSEFLVSHHCEPLK